MNADSESSDSPRVQGESKNAGAEDTVEAVRHFAVVASFIVKFSASRGGFAVIDCCSNGGRGECPSAEYSFRFKIVVLEADDVTYATGYRTCNGAGSGHPSLRWEGVDVGR